MLIWSELVQAMTGLWQLLHWEAKGFNRFSPTRGAFLRSFLAALLLLPVVALVLLDDLRAGHIAIIDPQRFALVELGGYLLSWLTYPLFVALIARWFGRWSRFCHTMTVTNWFQLAQIFLLLPLRLLADLGGPPEQQLLLWIVSRLVFLAYNIFITRHCLDLPTGTATALVVTGFLMDLLNETLTDRLAGLTPW